jgi:uncharacterized protein (TIGR03435 family)
MKITYAATALTALTLATCAVLAAQPPDVDVDSDPQAARSRMLAMLLEDRFKLRAHAETRETDVYALVVSSKDGKTGPDLRRSTIDCPVFISPALRVRRRIPFDGAASAAPGMACSRRRA